MKKFGFSKSKIKISFKIENQRKFFKKISGSKETF
jgi:hypothetical protein